MRRSHTPPAFRYIYKIHLEPRTISFYFTFIVLRKIRIEIEIAVFFRLLLHTAFFFSSCWCMAWIRSVRALVDDLCFIFLSLLVFFFCFVLFYYFMQSPGPPFCSLQINKLLRSIFVLKIKTKHDTMRFWFVFSFRANDGDEMPSMHRTNAELCKRNAIIAMAVVSATVAVCLCLFSRAHCLHTENVLNLWNFAAIHPACLLKCRRLHIRMRITRGS